MASATADKTLRLLQVYRETNDPRAREQVAASYAPLVRRLCSRFRGSKEPQEDLFQVGMIGLLNAIEKFDPGYGASFSSLAIPVVHGSILNYLRDHGSLIKVPRALRRNKLAVDKASERLTARLGRWPTVAELAQECELSVANVNATMELASTWEPRSLDEGMESDDGDGTVTLSDLLGHEDKEYNMSLGRMTVEAALSTLPVRERTILTLRYYQELPQRQVARRMDISQMHVSRLERKALLKLRLYIQSRGANHHPTDSQSQTALAQLPAA